MEGIDWLLTLGFGTKIDELGRYKIIHTEPLAKVLKPAELSL